MLGRTSAWQRLHANGLASPTWSNRRIPTPASRSAASWNGTLAALKSRRVPDDDPRVAECLAALAFWRCRRVIDTEAGHLVPEHAGALADRLRQEAVAG